MAVVPKLRTVGQHAHPVGKLATLNMALNPNLSLFTPGTVTRTNRINVPNFEGQTTPLGWSSTGAGYTACTIAISATQKFSGTQSMLVTWPTTTAAHSVANWPATGLTIGTVYAISFYVYVPTGNPAVKLLEIFSASGTTSTTNNQWERLTLIFTATATSHFFGITPTTAPTAGQICYVDATLLEASSTINPYFDGSTPAGVDTTVAWLGTVNNSMSTLAQNSITNWNATNCTFIQDANNVKFGKVGGKWVNTSTSLMPSLSQTFNVTALQDYTASVWLKIPSTLSSSGISLLGYVYASDNTPVTSDGITPIVLGGPIVGSAITAGYIRASTLMTAPVGAATIVLTVVPTGQPTSFDTIYLDGLQFEPNSTAGTYADGDMSGCCWSGAKGLSTTLSTGFPSSLHAFQVGALAGAVSGMTAHATLTRPNVLTAQS